MHFLHFLATAAAVATVATSFPLEARDLAKLPRNVQVGQTPEGVPDLYGGGGARVKDEEDAASATKRNVQVGQTPEGVPDLYGGGGARVKDEEDAAQQSA